MIKDGLVRTNYKIQQALLIHKLNEDFLRPLLVLDDKLELHAYPEHSITHEIAKQTFIFTANIDAGVLNGYSVAFAGQVSIFTYFIDICIFM